MTAEYSVPGMHAHYTDGTNLLDVFEGNVCSLSPHPCGQWQYVGVQAFGPLAGTMGSVGNNRWMAEASTSNPNVGYMMIGKGMSEATFRSFAAAMHKLD